MEFARIQLKICEACGCLWYRAHNQSGVYCAGCAAKLKEFPPVESRHRRPGRPGQKSAPGILGVAEAFGGVR